MKLITVLRTTLGAALALTLAAPAIAQTFAETPQTPQDEASFTPPPFKVTFEDRAQPPMGRVGDMRETTLAVKFAFEHFASDSLKAGEVNVCLPVGDKKRQAGIMNPCVVGEFDFGHADFGNALQVFGGVRFEDADNEKATFFAEVDGGISHFLGSGSETDLTIKFGGGAIIALNDKNFKLTVQFFIPIIFFSGAHETGFEIGAGISLPIGGK